MKKISEKKYALALFESIKNKDKKLIEKDIKNFVLILKKNNKLSSIDKILEEFGKIYDQKNKITDAQITTYSVTSKKQKEEIEKIIKKLANSKTINAKYNVSKEILGGIIIKYGDRIINASIKNKLNNLKIELNK